MMLARHMPCVAHTSLWHGIPLRERMGWRGAEHERRKPVPCPYQLGQIRPSIHALDRPRQTGQDTPYRGVSVMSANVRPDKTQQRLLISLRFFLSNRTNQRKTRTNGHVRPCPATRAKKDFCRGGRIPYQMRLRCKFTPYINISRHLARPVRHEKARLVRPGQVSSIVFRVRLPRT
jgi:hypothetical protein